jgi:hypothetical protein
MSRPRKRLVANFEARSVQLIAACTLGLAGVAAVHGTPSARITGQSSTASSQSSSGQMPSAARTVAALGPLQRKRQP